MTRRGFLWGLLGMGLVSASQSGCQEKKPRVRPPIDLGENELIAPGFHEYPKYRIGLRKGEGGELFAVRMVCTHQVCLLRKEGEGFLCPCHGSRFSPEGEVLRGPATENLRTLRVELIEGRVLVFQS